MALRYAHYGYMLENGRVVLDGSGKALGENEDVKEFYSVSPRAGEIVPRGQALSPPQALAGVAVMGFARPSPGSTILRGD